MGLATKRRGWTFQYPTKEFYHRLNIDNNINNSIKVKNIVIHCVIISYHSLLPLLHLFTCILTLSFTSLPYH